MGCIKLAGVECTNHWEVYITGLNRPHVCVGTIGILIEKGNKSEIIWNENVSGVDFPMGPMPNPHRRRIPDSFFKIIPYSDAVKEISKNKWAKEAYEEAKQEFGVDLFNHVVVDVPRRPINEPPEDCVLVAHDTGDGWALGVEDRNGEMICSLRWPWSNERAMSAGELRQMGFRIE